MGDPKGYLTIPRKKTEYRPVEDRLADYRDVAVPRGEGAAREQASRCMDCGTPFCHWACPVGNHIPEWNDAVHGGKWRAAWELLSAANNLPEITGRLCPALCESSCVLGINDDPVTVRENELNIAERAFAQGVVVPHPPGVRTGRRVAVVGSGPAGLAAADQLNRAGHTVVVLERDPAPGGIMRYGIPDFKLEKWILDRRIGVWRAEGIEFRCGVDVGRDYPVARLREEFDAVLLAGGSRTPRDLPIPGRELGGIHFAMDFLTQANRRAAGEEVPEAEAIHAGGKRVVVIGGGDTGADCVGTSHRQGAASVTQIEVLPQPPVCRPDDTPWPRYPLLLKTSTSHQEGGERQWAVLTRAFSGREGRVAALECVRVKFPVDPERKCPVMTEVPGSGFSLEADLVLLAVGFTGPEREGLLADLGVALDARGNVRTGEDRMTSVPGVFAAGDMRRGQSLIVWAVAEGRQAARAMDAWLMGSSTLP
jgi:glutamate synthase (NADPH/NADH) small chain